MMGVNNHIERGFFITENIHGTLTGSGFKPLDKKRVLAQIIFQFHWPTPSLGAVSRCQPVVYDPQKIYLSTPKPILLQLEVLSMNL